MNRKMLSGLIVVNVVLLLMLMLTVTGPPAEAQGRIRSGDYVMVAGRTPGRTVNTVYIVDLNNDIMLTVRYNNARRTLEPVGIRRMSADFESSSDH